MKSRIQTIQGPNLLVSVHGKPIISFSNKGENGGLLRVEEKKNEDIFKGNIIFSHKIFQIFILQLYNETKWKI